MHAPEETPDEPIRIESFGVRIDVWVDESVPRDAVLSVLPPGWQPAPDSFSDAQFSIVQQGEWRYVVGGDGTGRVSQAVDLDVALSFLESHVRECVARWARERVFVHAGVVAKDGRALVVPGDSFSGKSTLVAALVEAGATYFSDEFAVLDDEGLVHPYAKPLWLRSSAGEHTDAIPVSELGGPIGDAPIPAALVLVTSYVPGASFDPQPVSAGEAALALLSHTVPAQERPAEALRAVRRVAERSSCVRGDRGEADLIAPRLLEMLAAG